MTTLFTQDIHDTAILDVARHTERCQCSNPNHNHSDLQHLSYVNAFNSYGDDTPPFPPGFVTAAYQASQRQLAAAHGWPALVDV